MTLSALIDQLVKMKTHYGECEVNVNFAERYRDGDLSDGMASDTIEKGQTYIMEF